MPPSRRCCLVGSYLVASNYKLLMLVGLITETSTSLTSSTHCSSGFSMAINNLSALRRSRSLYGNCSPDPAVWRISQFGEHPAQTFLQNLLLFKLVEPRLPLQLGSKRNRTTE